VTVRLHRNVTAGVLLLMLAGCSPGPDEVTAAWCEAAADMYEYAFVIEEPETATPADQQEAIERGEAFFATTPPDEVADAVSTIRDGAELEQLGAAGDEIAAYAEEHCEGVDPTLFETDN
jgi:hypothetical protein